MGTWQVGWGRQGEGRRRWETVGEGGCLFQSQRNQDPEAAHRARRRFGLEAYEEMRARGLMAGMSIGGRMGLRCGGAARCICFGARLLAHSSCCGSILGDGGRGRNVCLQLAADS